MLTFCLAQTPPSAVTTPPAAVDPIEGNWTGLVTAPDGRTAQVGFGFKRGRGTSLDLVFDMPDMFTFQANLPEAVETKPDSYVIALLGTTLHREGDSLTGAFGLGKLPLRLKRGGSFEPEPPAPHYPAAPAPLWSRSLGCYTWASPVGREDMIYVGTKDGKFHAAKATDGTEVWTWTGPNRIDGRAVITDDRIYFVDGRVDLIALNRAGGSLAWRVPLHDASFVGGQPPADNPTFNRRTATPLVTADTVYCGSSDGGLYALDAATGRKLWRHDARSPIFSGIAQVAGDVLSFGCMDGSVVQLNRRTRQETSRMRTGGGVVTTPVFTAGKVVAGSRDYMLYGFNAADGSVAWKFSYWFSWVESTPQLVDGVLYVGASDFRRVTALNPADGRALWSTDVRGIAWGWPLVTADTVFIGTVAQNVPGTLIHHTGGLMALDRKTGAVKWQHLSPVPPENSFGGYAGSLVLAGDKLIAIGYDGVLIAFPAK